MTERAVKQPQINIPEVLTGPERTRDTLITALMWGVYLYLWVPLVSFFAWVLGFELAYDVMIRTGGAAGLEKVVVTYFFSVLIIFAIVTAWSLGNRLRYGKLSRRRSISEITLAPTAAYFGVDLATASRLRSLKLSKIDFDDEGRPLITPHVPRRHTKRDNLQWTGSDATNAATSASQSQP